MVLFFFFFQLVGLILLSEASFSSDLVFILFVGQLMKSLIPVSFTSVSSKNLIKVTGFLSLQMTNIQFLTECNSKTN